MMIAVIGGDSVSAESQHQAEAVGREIARRGHVLVSGGRAGVADAACRGAREAGGHTVGILPGPDRRDANRYVEFPVVTNLGAARNTIVVLSADAIIALGGAYGTLSEIALALVHGKRVVGLGTWRMSDDAGIEDKSVLRARDPVEAVDIAVEAAEGARPAVKGVRA